MPRAVRSIEEVEAVREEILESAIEIMREEGFDNLTMAKVGARMSMTAANIYNYFNGKTDLYLAIHEKSFNLLHEFISRSLRGEDKLERVRRILEAYVEFGIRNPHRYEIMFCIPTPKYDDYVGTTMEGVALEARRNSLRILEMAADAVEDLLIERGGLEGRDARKIALEYWCLLHGLVSLHNNGLISAAYGEPEELVRWIVGEGMRHFRRDMDIEDFKRRSGKGGGSWPIRA